MTTKGQFTVTVDGDSIVIQANQGEWGKVGYRDVYVQLRQTPSLEGEATVPAYYYEAEYKRLSEAFGKDLGKVILGTVRAIRAAKEMAVTDYEKSREEAWLRDAAERKAKEEAERATAESERKAKEEAERAIAESERATEATLAEGEAKGHDVSGDAPPDSPTTAGDGLGF